jgi:hypothetical protein
MLCRPTVQVADVRMLVMGRNGCLPPCRADGGLVLDGYLAVMLPFRWRFCRRVRGCWLVIAMPPWRAWRIFAIVVVFLRGCLRSCLLTLDNILGGSALLSAGSVLRLAFRAVRLGAFVVVLCLFDAASASRCVIRGCVRLCLCHSLPLCSAFGHL